jgi:hypothetical protein
MVGPTQFAIKYTFYRVSALASRLSATAFIEENRTILTALRSNLVTKVLPFQKVSLGPELE